MKKRLLLFSITLSITVLIIVGTGSVAGAIDFTDVKEADWYHRYIKILVDKDIISGMGDGTFAPNRTINVDEFLAITLRTMREEQPVAQGYWAGNYINKALGLGLIADGEYQRYDVPITREKMAKIIVLAVDYDYVDYLDYKNFFNDRDKMTERDFVLKAFELGVIAGDETGAFRPQDTATRAEAATIALRMIDPGYRLQLLGDIFFCPKLDLDAGGRVNAEKAKSFVGSFIDSFILKKGRDGNIVISGHIPKVPEGQFVSMNITFFDKAGRILDGTYSTGTELEGRKVPAVGVFNIGTAASVADTDGIMLNILITTGEPDGYTVAFCINKSFVMPESNYFLQEELEREVDLDFNLTEDMWRW
jgi:hypothetical protein